VAGVNFEALRVALSMASHHIRGAHRDVVRQSRAVLDGEIWRRLHSGALGIAATLTAYNASGWNGSKFVSQARSHSTSWQHSQGPEWAVGCHDPAAHHQEPTCLESKFTQTRVRYHMSP
jgi:hypothetical protein